jgi:hypothetical protein
MRPEKEIDITNSDDSELYFDEEPEPRRTLENVLDARDMIEPLKEVQPESSDGEGSDQSDEWTEESESEVELPLDGDEDPPEDNRAGNETEISLTDDNEQTAAEVAQEDSAEDPAEDPTNDHAIKADNDSNTAEIGDEGDAFLGLDDGEMENKPSEEKKTTAKETLPKKPDDAESAKTAVNSDKSGTSPQEPKPKENAPKSVKTSRPKVNVNRQATINTVISFMLLVLIFAGFILYYNPHLIGLQKASNPAPPAVSEPVPTPMPQQSPPVPVPAEKKDEISTILEEATQLRNQLLAKKEEIYELDLYYRNGISELEQNIFQEAQREGIISYEQALKNKRIELNLRTIQRRQAYIRELQRPSSWLNAGSEELLYLTRNAQLDLAIGDIAGGIDINKHKRHISAAIYKYRPEGENLAVDRQETNMTPLETIWQRIKKLEDTKDPVSLNPKDKQIIDEICSGNFGRIAELTAISPEAAGCLAQMKGSDLFLNGVTKLSPAAAQNLFQWQGNWIGLNGIKELSPAAAKYLFKWSGKWISLNSLTDFPPELGLYLLRWEGQQLELMGLNIQHTESDPKALKFLALWEATGGKLFVPDEIRETMKRIL